MATKVKAKRRAGYWEMPLPDYRVRKILDAVDDQWWDRGKTDFATPEEFCQVILHLQQELKSDKYLALVKTHGDMLKLLKQFIKTQKHEKI